MLLLIREGFEIEQDLSQGRVTCDLLVAYILQGTNCDESVVERRVVMADVAKLAKVSSQTVSRVLSGKGTVRPETERRVRNAIEYLGYQPSIAG